MKRSRNSGQVVPLPAARRKLPQFRFGAGRHSLVASGVRLKIEPTVVESRFRVLVRPAHPPDGGQP